MLAHTMPIDPDNLPCDPLRRLEALMAVLRGPQGCPWDRKQDHRSLRQHLLEETCEVLEELDRRPLDPGRLAEELGDVLLQVVFHAQLARERTDFDLDEIARLINAKLVRRHPHVFGTTSVEDADQVRRTWHRAKQAELKDAPPDALPSALPALARAQRLAARECLAGRKPVAASADLEEADRTWRRLRQEALAPTAEQPPPAGSHERRLLDLGHLLWVIAVMAEAEGLDAEAALREAAARYRHPPEYSQPPHHQD